MRYNSMAAIKRANKAAGKYWFEKATMAFFNTRIHTTTPIGGRYFVTSERMDRGYPWKYSVRMAEANGSIDTIGNFQQFDSSKAATAYARSLAKLEKDVPDNPVKGGHTKKTIDKNIATLVREGREEKQAVAIAYASARSNWRRRHTKGPYPKHLRRRC